MKEIKIDKKIENQVESIIILANQLVELKNSYQDCFKIIKKQFNLGDYSESNFVQDDIENIKISLYAEIVRQNHKDIVIKEKKINDKLTK